MDILFTCQRLGAKSKDSISILSMGARAVKPADPDKVAASFCCSSTKSRDSDPCALVIPRFTQGIPRCCDIQRLTEDLLHDVWWAYTVRWALDMCWRRECG